MIEIGIIKCPIVLNIYFIGTLKLFCVLKCNM